MANKFNIQEYPIIGDLNLSKNKLDIEDSGFLKNDGVYYGNTLSPIWKNDTNESYNFYDNKQIPYKVNSDNGQLIKNGDVVMEYDQAGFTESLLEEKNIVAYFSDSQKVLEYNDHLTINGQPFYFLSNSITTFFNAKYIDENNVLLLVQKSDNLYYLLRWYDGSIEEVQLLAGWSDIGASFISVYQHSNFYVISVYSDKKDPYVNTFIFDGNTIEPAVFVNNDSGQVQVPHVVETTWDKVGTTHSFNEANVSYPVYVNKNYNQGGAYTNTTEMRYNDNLPKDQTDSLEIKLYWCSGVTTPDSQTSWNNSGNWNTTNGKTLEYLSNMEIDPENIAGNLDFNGFVSFCNLDNPTDINIHNLTVEEGKSYLIGTLNGPFSEINIDVTNLYKYNFTKGAFVYPNTPGGTFKYLGIFWVDIRRDGESIFKGKWLPKAYTRQDSNILMYSNPNDVKNCGIFLDLANNNRIYTSDILSLVTIESIDVKPNVECNGILSNGQIINTQSPLSEETVLNSGAYAFSGIIDSIDDSVTPAEISYTTNNNSLVYLGLVNDLKRAFPYYFVSHTIQLDEYYFRHVVITKGADQETETVLLYDNGLDKVLVNPGINAQSNQNLNGSRVSFNDNHWCLLYNKGFLSAISYAEDSNTIGTLLTEWDYIDKVLFINQDVFVYKDINGNTIKLIDLPTNEGNDWKYKVILNRYIVLNTISYYNCYDTKTDNILHYTSDYNDRILQGTPVVDYLGWSENTKKLFNDTLLENFIYGTAQNAAYQVSQSQMTSYKSAANIYKDVYIGNNPIQCNKYDAIEIYYGTNETTAIYQYTYKNGTTYKDSLLDDIYFTNDIVYSPNMFSKFIYTWNMNDLIINSSTKTAYPLQKYNGQLYLAYLLENGLENAENVFVVQTLYYMVSDGKIWEIVYDNGSISNFICVANVHNMKYIGCLPTMAIFYSEMDRTFWSFSGDAILRRFLQANDINKITGTFYNTATQELFVGTDIGLLCLNDINNYLIEDAKNVDKMFFFEDYFIYGQYTGTEGGGDEGQIDG